MTDRKRRITRMIAAFFKADPGAQARFAAMTGETETTVAHWFSDHGARLYRMPVDLLPDAVEAVGKAAEIYGAIVAENDMTPPAPRARPTASPTPLLSRISEIFQECGRLGGEIAAAGTDVDEDEAERIFAVVLRARAALDEMAARLPLRAARGTP